jgi:hypothetical protein
VKGRYKREGVKGDKPTYYVAAARYPEEEVLPRMLLQRSIQKNALRL